MIRHLLRTRYRIVHDAVNDAYSVEYRRWWSLWFHNGNSFATEQTALDYLTMLQHLQRPDRFSVVHEC